MRTSRAYRDDVGTFRLHLVATAQLIQEQFTSTTEGLAYNANGRNLKENSKEELYRIYPLWGDHTHQDSGPVMIDFLIFSKHVKFFALLLLTRQDVQPFSFFPLMKIETLNLNIPQYFWSPAPLHSPPPASTCPWQHFSLVLILPFEHLADLVMPYYCWSEMSFSSHRTVLSV